MAVGFVLITTDASPYGIGGVLSKCGKVESYFSDTFTDF